MSSCTRTCIAFPLCAQDLGARLCSNCNCESFMVFIQEVAHTCTNSNYTCYPVARIQGTVFGTGQFGTIDVYDNPVTIAASQTSISIVRFQGIYAMAALGVKVFYISGTIQFTGGQYANSMLSTEGLGNSLVNVPAQLGIDGGTNTFNEAVGNITLVTISLQGLNPVVLATINYKMAV